MSEFRNYGQYRDFDRVQTARWNKLASSQEQQNLLNYNIQLEDITLGTGGNTGKVLLDGANLTLLKGKRYGLCGRNGVGKSTLLRHIAEHKIMGIFDHLRCVYIDDGAQVAFEDPAQTTIGFMLSVHKERLTLVHQLVSILEGAEEVNTDALEHLIQKLAELRADEAHSRAMKILAGLDIPPQRPISQLSGGQRHLAALATALFIDADVLLLDEPTNHCDLRAISWLEEFLNSCRSTVVVVSHDQEFLNNVATDIISFELRTLKQYKGNYENFISTRTLQLQHQQSLYTAQEIRRKRLERTIANLQAREARCGGTGSRIIHSRRMTLKSRLGESLDNVRWKYGLMGPRPEVLAPPEDEPFSFEFLTDVSDVPEASGNGETLLLKLDDVGYSYDKTEGKPVIGGVSFEVTLSTRLALIGKNGTGKTTLLNCISGDLAPQQGSVLRWNGLRVGYFTQHAVKEISSLGDTAMELLHAQHPTLQKQECRNLLGALGFLGEIAETTPMSSLSDGQRARVLIASLLGSKPHLLLLDEVTSHCDHETAAAIAQALGDFAGAVILASHDRAFVSEVAVDLYCTDPGRIGLFSGDFHQYKSLLLAEIRAASNMVLPVSIQPSSRKKSTPLQHTKEVAQGSPQRNAPLPANAGHISCRHCGEGHFSHACPNKPQSRTAAPSANTNCPSAPATQQQKKPPQLPPMTEKATDGKGDWKVAVPKSVIKKLKKGSS